MIYTDIHATKQLNIENQGTGSALNVKQINPSYSIFNASNSYSEVFTILNNGSVGIGGIIPSTDNLLEVRGNINIVSYLTDDYKSTINGRDIIKDTSNYTLATSNIITDRINNLTADDIQNGLINKYIVSGVYNGDIELRGDFIASNVTINGEKTKLFNNIFSTEVLEISNNGKYSTLNVSQLDTSYDIFNAYNNTGNVFTILGNGNIGIGTKNPSSILEVSRSFSSSKRMVSDSKMWKEVRVCSRVE